ncbi:hypothetical protein [Breoghania sp.]|uniref:hypothetical protein n=1 Tax=Breoghania sp. TaxID=2065378 RepID=UPI002AABF624|nr:hypothetical protein [Breoghania sp.]
MRRSDAMAAAATWMGSHAGRGRVKGLLAAAVLSMSLAGCAGDPDATLLGVVMVPPGTVANGAPLIAPAVAQSKPAVSPASAPAEPSSARERRPEYLYDPDSPNKVVSNTVAPIAYAEPKSVADRLKTSDEVLRTEEELRTLAQRNSGSDERGLWNAKIRDLLAKRDSHIDNAIRKIEETEAN